MQNIGSIDDGADVTPWNSVMPMGMPITMVIRTPKSIAPCTFLIYRKPVISRPMMPSSAEPLVTSPSVTSVASLLAIMPADCKPIKAIKRPMPAPIA